MKRVNGYELQMFELETRREKARKWLKSLHEEHEILTPEYLGKVYARTQDSEDLDGMHTFWSAVRVEILRYATIHHA